MATEHVSITSSNCHEPKHITNATTADAGKVLTPSATSAGTSVLRPLVLGEYDYVIGRSMTDINTATIDHIPVPVGSTLTKVTLVTSGASVITAATTITINYGVAGTSLGTIVVPIGTVAGTLFTLNTLQACNVGDIIEIDSDGVGSNITRGFFTLRFDRT